jgi:transcriptional regulator with PAS, ATPase and Fis domain
MATKLIGISENINRIKEVVRQVAGTGLNILVCGETGVGKEVVVQHLYQKSNRKGKAFLKVNCAALPDTLLESEMFGYEQGAFTGADRRMRGKVEQACGGILFLDEIGDMSFQLQSKLLHVLQGGEYSPLGSERSVKTDAWIIAATNHDLQQDIQNAKFREDLYYRLSTIKIDISPLRERPEDIPLLIDYYVREFSRRFGSKKLHYPNQETIDNMTAYHWPGNVRELENVIKRIMILGDDETTMNDLLNTPAASNQAGSLNSGNSETLIITDLLGSNGDNAIDLNSLSLKKIRKKALGRVEKEVISYVLAKTGWNRSKAVKILKISYKTLLYKINDLNITPPPQF